MQEFIEKVVNNFKEFFVGLEPGKKMGLVAVSALALVSLSGLSIYASKITFILLYTALNRD